MPKKDVITDEIMNSKLDFNDTSSKDYEATKRACRYLGVKFLNHLFAKFEDETGAEFGRDENGKSLASLSEENKKDFILAMFDNFGTTMERMKDGYNGKRNEKTTVGAFLNFYENNKDEELLDDFEHKILSSIKDTITEKFEESMEPGVKAFLPYMDHHLRNNSHLLKKEDMFGKIRDQLSDGPSADQTAWINNYKELPIIKVTEGKPHAERFFDFFKKNFSDMVKELGENVNLYDSLSKAAKNAMVFTKYKTDNNMPLSQDEERLAKVVAGLAKNNRLGVLDDPKKNGEKLYRTLKEAVIHEDYLKEKREIKAGIDKEICLEEFGANNNKKPFAGLLGEKTLLGELTTLLNSGDKFGRGSSGRYKEIQKDIKNLDKFLKDNSAGFENNTGAKLYVATVMSNIAEKAAIYVGKHKNVELNYSKDSYEGKRVHLMRTVFNQLEQRAKAFEIGRSDYFSDKEIKSGITKEMIAPIKARFEKEGFSGNLYSKVRALENAIDHNKTLKVAFSDAKRYKESEAMKTLMKGLEGEKISPKKLDSFYKAALVNFDKIRNAAQTKNLDLLNAIKTDAVTVKNDMLMRGSVGAVSFTGNDKVDNAMCKLMIDACDTVPGVIKTNEIKAPTLKNEERKNLEFLDNPFFK